MRAGSFRLEPEDVSRCSFVNGIGNGQEMLCASLPRTQKPGSCRMMVVSGFIQKLFTLE